MSVLGFRPKTAGSSISLHVNLRGLLAGRAHSQGRIVPQPPDSLARGARPWKKAFISGPESEPVPENHFWMGTL